MHVCVCVCEEGGGGGGGGENTWTVIPTIALKLQVHDSLSPHVREHVQSTISGLL